MVASNRSPPPVLTPPVSPYSPSRSAVRSPYPKREDNSSLSYSTAAVSCSSFEYDHDGYSHGEGGNERTACTSRLPKGSVVNLVLEGEAQRLDALKRRRFMELQQMLALKLRTLAREASTRCRRARKTHGATQQCSASSSDMFAIFGFSCRNILVICVLLNNNVHKLGRYIGGGRRTHVIGISTFLLGPDVAGACSTEEHFFTH